MSLVTTKQAVDAIVQAQQQNMKEISIPTSWYYINVIMRCVIIHTYI